LPWLVVEAKKEKMLSIVLLAFEKAFLKSTPSLAKRSMVGKVFSIYYQD